MENKPVAIVLFGGICSGKTTFATKFEKEFDFNVISKDRSILESEILCRKGIHKTWEVIREETINYYAEKKASIILDETVRIGRLSKLKENNYQIIGVKLNVDFNTQKMRMENRNNRQKEILMELSSILDMNISAMKQADRRDLWRSSNIYEYVAPHLRNKFDSLIFEIYTLGCHYIKHENPNPTCFSELSSVIEIDSTNSFQDLDIDFIISNSIPFKEFAKKYLKRIRYCIWDVGGVIYKYTLSYLDKWCESNTQNPLRYIHTKGTFDYDPYMKGEVSFSDLCKQLCEFYDVEYHLNREKEIEDVFWQGVSEDFPLTHNLMKLVEKNNITNCILSNALPILLESGEYQKFVGDKFRFYSFDLHMLKPDDSIYVAVKEKLGCSFHEMVFVDDKIENVNSAIELGIYSIQYNNELDKDLFFKTLS